MEPSCKLPISFCALDLHQAYKPRASPSALVGQAALIWRQVQEAPEGSVREVSVCQSQSGEPVSLPTLGAKGGTGTCVIPSLLDPIIRVLVAPVVEETRGLPLPSCHLYSAR